MIEFFQKLFSSEFMPHGHCYYWQPSIVWLHVISDSLIALSYYSIPIALVYFVRKRKDLAFNWMFVLFALFILACGTTHVMEIWNIWHADYRLSGLLKAFTAAASIPTAILLWPLIPKALKLPSPAALESANKALEDEVSERKQAIKDATVKLQNESRIKDEFLATLSHELRTPLNSILGWVQLIQRKSTPENIQRGIEVIDRNTRLQAQLIEDLLDTSRITSGKLNIEMRFVDLGTVVQSAIASIEPTAEARSIQIERSLEPLPIFIKGDAARVQQIVWNLLSNAAKFTPDGGKIRIVLEQKNELATIIVIDSGVGIAPDFLPFIFDRFRQADSSTTRKFAGLGLGLSVAKHLVELHGGSIKAESLGEGKGASFIVTFPCVAVPAVTLEDTLNNRSDTDVKGVHTPESLEPFRGIRILIVDDERDSREVVRNILEEHGASVLTASSTDEALDIFSKESINLLISDIGMPNRDGFDLIQAVRKSDDAQKRATPAIALTAFARSEDKAKTFAFGYQSHVAKPIEAAELIAIVKTLGTT